MRSKLFVASAVLLVWIAEVAAAQTVTPTQAPTPTPTPPPHLYLSDEFMANTQTTGNQRRPAVASGTDDRFLVVWHGDAAQTGFFDIQAQLFDRVAAKVGPEFQVDQAPAGRVMYTPDVASGGDGHYIVVWADFNQTVTDSEIWMRRLDASGAPLAPAVQVNTYTTASQRLPRLAADSAGNFVVVWESVGQDGNGLGVFGQRFDASGAPVGGEFAVNTVSAGDQDRAVVAMNDSGFAVAFEDGAGGIALREFPVSPAQAPALQSPSVPDVSNPAIVKFADLADGTSNTLLVGERSPIVLAARHENGVPGNLFLVSPNTPGDVFFGPSGAANAAGDLASVCWRRGTGTPTQYTTGCRQYGWTGTRLKDVGRLWGAPWSQFALLPYIEQDSVFGSRHLGCAQRSNGANDDVWCWYGGYPGGSVHTGGAQFAFGDGSVKFITSDIPASVYASLSNNLGSPQDWSGIAESTPLQSVRGVASPSAIVINDGTADYGTVQPGERTDCTTTGDCYNITVPGPRPGLHWDEPIMETLSTGVKKTWLLHVGESFADVPDTNIFIEFIENLLHNGVTAGGACGGYCPLDGVKRQQMAVFLLKSFFGPAVVPPPATGTIFTDVPITNPFAAWIEALYLLGITGGCSGGPPPAPIQFCPDAIVNRQQMAVFLLKTFEGSAYVPPAATGIFQDLPPANPFAAWAEELYDRQITGGCVANPLQYCPTNPTNRQQMAAFLVKTFGLLLYGP
jgi:prepilin-type processing-associated H-X9-DG protein